MVLLDHKDLQVPMVPRDHKDYKVIRDRRDLPEPMVQLGHRDL